MTKRGIPFTVEELRQAAEQPPDPYHRELMQWAAKRIETLERRLYGIVDEIYPHTLECDMRAGQTIAVRIPKPFITRD